MTDNIFNDLYTSRYTRTIIIMMVMGNGCRLIETTIDVRSPIYYNIIISFDVFCNRLFYYRTKSIAIKNILY